MEAMKFTQSTESAIVALLKTTIKDLKGNVPFHNASAEDLKDKIAKATA